jgi:ABC-2 type transport system ATP-binding protein
MMPAAMQRLGNPARLANNTGVMERETLVVASHLSRRFGARRALQDVGFSAARGEIVGLLGANGAGKTTTLRILCGVLAPDTGRITIAGHDLHQRPAAAKRHLGYLPEQPPLYDDLRVARYLAYCARLRRVPEAKLETAVDNTLDRCGLTTERGRLIGNLSKGTRQRVGIAQAIVHAPDLIVLDEPTVGLDPNQIVEIRSLIADLGADHCVIFSSHILSEVQSLCSRVLILHEGRLILDQALAALRAAEICSVTIGMRHPPDEELLRRCEDVLEVRRLDARRFQLRFRAGGDGVERFAERAARDGWGLVELSPAAGTLEDTYLGLTRGA